MTERERLIRLLEQAKEKAIDTIGSLNNGFGAWYADHLLANGVVCPPCKVGDTVWVNWEHYKGVKKTCPVKVYALRFDTKKNNMRICVEGYFKISYYGGNYTHHYNGTFAWDSVGKTVFRSREEAEAALERSRG